MIGAPRSAPRRWNWILGSLALGLLATLVAGCSGSLDTGYSIDLIYPLRRDPLVTVVPKIEPTQPIPPGKLDESIRKLPETGGKLLDPERLTDQQRSDLKAALDAAFGKPAQPLVRLVGKIDEENEEFAGLELSPQDVAKFLPVLRLTETELSQGGKLYRRHCMHCHGVAGDGRGPSGAWLSPTPRDFRQGQFKFVSSLMDTRRKPRRDDLKKTLVHGLEGTSMPSFALLKETEELEPLISYVIHLSLRGEVEYEAMRVLLTGGELSGKTIESQVATWQAITLARWADASAAPWMKPSALIADPETEAFKASVVKGYGLFTGKDLGCIGCHQDFGRLSRYRYDTWGTLVKPNNLTLGQYRGGRRPIDLYHRLRFGIAPSAMSSVPKTLADDDVWALVNFVRMLPYPDQLPGEVREKVYGKVAPGEGTHAAGGGQ